MLYKSSINGNEASSAECENRDIGCLAYINSMKHLLLIIIKFEAYLYL